MSHAAIHAEQIATIQLHELHCPQCADAVERTLHANPHITSVHLDWQHDLIHVGYHAGMIDEAGITASIAGTGCSCETEGMPAPTDHDHLMHTHPDAASRLRRLRHGVEVQPITMSTKYHRRQYERPAPEAHAHRPQTAPAVAQAGDHAAMDHGPDAGHARSGTMDHSGHMGMDHDMSDPSMAAA